MFGNNKKKTSAQTAVALIAASDKRGTASEQLRAIRSNINFTMVDKDLKTIAITSAEPNDGKTSVSSNLAIVYADSGKRVLLVDGDMRKPTLGISFDLTNPRGLSNLITERDIDLKKVINETGIENLSVMTAGVIPPNPSELLGSNRFIDVIEQLSAEFDLIIFDMPPLSNITDAQIVGSRVDGTVLVAREAKTNRDNIRQAKELLELAKAHIIGVIMNDAKKSNDANYYYYHG
jgi:capsular exopolysaccharide synthesis family protein